MPSNIYSATDNTISIPDTIPERKGYTFLGWAKKKGSKLLIDDKNIKLNDSTVFYAVWDKNDHFEMDNEDDYIISSIIPEDTYFQTEFIT